MISEAMAASMLSDTLLMLVISFSITSIAVPLFICCIRHYQLHSCYIHCTNVPRPISAHVAFKPPPVVYWKRLHRQPQEEPP